MKIAECRIVGALVAPRGKAPFDRAPVVVESAGDPGRYVQVRAYLDTLEVDGKSFGRAELDALVHSEQAIRIGPMPAAMGVAVWVLRPNFPGRGAALEELRAGGVLVHDKETGPDGSFLCAVREPEANRFRDGWAEKALEEALEEARCGRAERMLEAAQRAFVLERAMSPKGIGMLSLAYERGGERGRAEAYFGMSRRSRGEDFEKQAREWKAEWERRIGAEEEPRSEERPRFAAAIALANERAMKAGLTRIRGGKKRAA